MYLFHRVIVNMTPKNTWKNENGLDLAYIIVGIEGLSFVLKHLYNNLKFPNVECLMTCLVGFDPLILERMKMWISNKFFRVKFTLELSQIVLELTTTKSETNPRIWKEIQTQRFKQKEGSYPWYWVTTCRSWDIRKWFQIWFRGAHSCCLHWVLLSS